MNEENVVHRKDITKEVWFAAKQRGDENVGVNQGSLETFLEGSLQLKFEFSDLENSKTVKILSNRAFGARFMGFGGLE